MIVPEDSSFHKKWEKLFAMNTPWYIFDNSKNKKHKKTKETANGKTAIVLKSIL